MDERIMDNAMKIRQFLSDLGICGLFREEVIEDKAVVFERAVKTRKSETPHVFSLIAISRGIKCAIYGPIRIPKTRQAVFLRDCLVPINRMACVGHLDLCEKGNYVYHVSLPTEYISDLTGCLQDAVDEVMGVLSDFGDRLVSFAEEKEKTSAHRIRTSVIHSVRP